GEALVGQCAVEKQRILLTQVPSDHIRVTTALGESTPLNIVVQPVVFEEGVLAVLELASLQRFTDVQLAFLDQPAESIGIVLTTMSGTMRTEELLKQSQSLAAELQTQQQELRETNRRLEEQANTLQASEERLKQQQEKLQEANEALGERAQLLGEQKTELERKNREVEMATLALREKAEQLALTSKYKSEFLTNMSHELRTPLNSMLILSKMLADNPERRLTEKQVEYAKSIHTAGSDLLVLINDILDLSKIESGTVELDMSDMLLTDVQGYMEQTFRPVAEGKGL